MLGKIFSLFAIIVACLLTACKDSSSGDSIDIGLLTSTEGYWQGISKGANLAVNEINAGGGVLEKPIKLITKTGGKTLNEGVRIAESFSDNGDLVAVIGHLQSYITLPVSPIYESAKKIMITPGATSNRITNQGFKYIFRMIPSNKDMGKYLAQYAKAQGYKRILIFYTRDEYGTDLANELEKSAFANDIDVVDRRSYIDQSAKYHKLLKFWQRNYTFDAMFLIGALPESGEIVNQVRASDIVAPIIGADTLNDPLLIEVAGKNSEGITFTTFSNGDSASPKRAAFDKAYQKEYGIKVSESALLGYDAVYLIADAIKSSKSKDPTVVAEYLHTMPNFEGLLGFYGFDIHGNLVGKNHLHLGRVKDKKIVVIDDEPKIPSPDKR